MYIHEKINKIFRQFSYIWTWGNYLKNKCDSCRW